MDNFKLGNKSIDLDYISALDNRDSFDEVDKLGLTFLNMQSSINKNMQSILELTLSEEKLKYQLLQSQINPHFLYNILGTIQTCQTIGKIDIANHMISNLTRFYRMSLRKSDEKIKIKDELEISKLYLEMEQLCRQDTLSWTINAEEGIENFLICKFTLQPFLENSILHGYSSEKTNIHININICYGDDEVIITIEDNGCGIPNDKLEQIRYKLSNHIVDYNQHFGICNVNKRISNTDFGNGIVLIESEERKGTKIIIKYAQMEDFS
ncbi:sensor histidine kinase [Lachnoanaerobaculum umeaense]|uniref:sensor histidine kinase n=1 Tax=Lachnoanaerobaculum umeaense TaxID=617123 RepID=UPI000DB1ECB4|nr:histidine kinase [Lachnoanaerobaculum umeaense]PZW93530.1 histidine kinase/DNA gyrase B/HSP90-like ATPase [Lachnoanaerobaculum umeaense]